MCITFSNYNSKLIIIRRIFQYDVIFDMSVALILLIRKNFFNFQ